MANVLWPRAKSNFLDGTVDWDNTSIRIAGVRGYTYNSAHQFRSDVEAAGGVFVASNPLAGRSVGSTGGASASDGNIGSPAAGAAITSLVIYTDTGSSTSDRLIAFIDGATGLPVTPNGTMISYTLPSPLFSIV